MELLDEKNNPFNIIAVNTMLILLSLYLHFVLMICALYDIFALGGTSETILFFFINFLVCKLDVVAPS